MFSRFIHLLKMAKFLSSLSLNNIPLHLHITSKIIISPFKFVLVCAYSNCICTGLYLSYMRIKINLNLKSTLEVMCVPGLLPRALGYTVFPYPTDCCCSFAVVLIATSYVFWVGALLWGYVKLMNNLASLCFHLFRLCLILFLCGCNKHNKEI